MTARKKYGVFVWAVLGFIVLSFIIYTGATQAQTCMDALGNPSPCTPEVDASYNTQGLAVRAADQLKNMIKTVETTIDRYRANSPFVPLGKKLIGVLGMIIIVWSITKGMILKPGMTQIIADLVFPFIMMSLAIVSLDKNLGEIVARSVESVSSAMSTSTGSTGSSSLIFAENMIKTMTVIWDAPNELSIASLGLNVVMAALLKLVAIFFIAAATAAGVAILLMAKFQIALAIALAPIMIPWGIWKPTEFLFSGWLTFLIKGGFMSIGVYAVESTIRASAASMADLASSVAPGVDSAFTYGVIALMAMLFALLMTKAADIGSGIISGAASGFSGFSAVTHGGAAAASKGAFGATGNTMKGGASLGSSYAMGKSASGTPDSGLSGLHKASRPQRGAGRVAYEMGRKQ